MPIDLILFLLLLVGIIIWLIHAELFLQKLRRSFPELHKELGSPSILGKKTSALPLLVFLMRREYRQLNDIAFVRMGNRIIVHFSLTLLFFVLFWLYIVFFAVA